MTSPWLLVNELTSRKKWRSGRHGQGDGEGAGRGVGQHMHGSGARCLEGRKDRASRNPSRERAAESGDHPGPRISRTRKTPRARNKKRALEGVVGESAPEEPQAGETRRVERERTGPRKDPAKPAVDQSRSPRGAPVQEDPGGKPERGLRGCFRIDDLTKVRAKLAGGRGDRGRKAAF